LFLPRHRAKPFSGAEFLTARLRIYELDACNTAALPYFTEYDGPPASRRPMAVIGRMGKDDFRPAEMQGRHHHYLESSQYYPFPRNLICSTAATGLPDVCSIGVLLDIKAPFFQFLFGMRRQLSVAEITGQSVQE
jgi:hypothetical protein